MRGLHLTADLRGCASARPLMTDPAVLRSVCRAAVEAAGLTAVGELFHRFAPAPAADPPPVPTPLGRDGTADNAGTARIGIAGMTGITGVVLLAESHLAVHTWPELDAATLDVYVCNFGADNSACAESLLGALIAAFAPGSVERHALERGAAPR